jgi:hypothetical protein
MTMKFTYYFTQHGLEPEPAQAATAAVLPPPPHHQQQQRGPLMSTKQVLCTTSAMLTVAAMFARRWQTSRPSSQLGFTARQHS